MPLRRNDGKSAPALSSGIPEQLLSSTGPIALHCLACMNPNEKKQRLAQVARQRKTPDGSNPWDRSGLPDWLRKHRPHLPFGETVVALDLHWGLVSSLVIARNLLGASWCEETERLDGEPLRERFRALLMGEPFPNPHTNPWGGLPQLLWTPSSLSAEDLRLLAGLLGELGRATTTDLASAPADRLGPLHHAVYPKALRHGTGEFFTPDWLAALLVKESGWTPNQRLIDPFCGSGVVLLAALNQGLEAGGLPEDLLSRIHGVEHQPLSVVAARANLLHWWLKQGRPLDKFRYSPIRLGDVLQPGQDEAAAPFDVVVTNPPWIGWEHLPEPVREATASGWKHYELYGGVPGGTSTPKEDLSTLALVTVWDRLLKDGGFSAVLLPAASMTSQMASRGLRRLRLDPSGTPLGLTRVVRFDGLNPFPGTRVKTALWVLQKGTPTHFPVASEEWHLRAGLEPPPMSMTLPESLPRFSRVTIAAAPSDPSDPAGRWMLGPSGHLADSSRLLGKSAYRGRTGVFTGGANSVYYLEPLEPLQPGERTLCRNRPERGRRAAPAVEAKLESDLLYEVVSGRDMDFWRSGSSGLLLCPHTATSRMDAIPPEAMESQYPATLAYLESMRPVLDARRGFSTWEEPYRLRAFYVLQRVGAYTFANYKVGWKYISDRFVPAVIGPDSMGRPRLPNDKVMFIATNSATEAYYLAGFLSSSPISWFIGARTSAQQVSASAIDGLAIPAFDRQDPRHKQLAALCRSGHLRKARDRHARVDDLIEAIDEIAGQLQSTTLTS